MKFAPEDIETTLAVLQQISEDPTLIDRHSRFKSLIAKIYKQAKKNKKRIQKQIQQESDRQLQFQTAIVQDKLGLTGSHFLSSANDTSIIGQLHKPKNCYICKQAYTKVHSFYHLLCPKCAEFNYQKRQQSTNLKGRVALITGGRVKIGYETTLRMLRDGAKVIVTTRFVVDTALRFSQEIDFDRWCNRLYLYPLDLRNLPSVEAFVEYLLETESKLDIIINNAAQTIKRPLAFYQHLLDKERDIYSILSSQKINLVCSHNRQTVLLEALPQYHNHLGDNIYFPTNKLDRDGQQLDTRPTNSWKLKLDEISTREMLEVQLVNYTAPFIFNSKLKPLLKKPNSDRSFIINVSAMEGQFNRKNKTTFHPHTNMAKAALNMMTRTAAEDYAKDNIYMNSVDTGWITNENPYPLTVHQEENKGFYPPLDNIDGMARIYDPIVKGINDNELFYGHFLKDYKAHEW